MFDPDFFTDEQYQNITSEFYKYAKKKHRPILDKESMKTALSNLDIIPKPTEAELNAMCTSNRTDLEEFFITIFCYLRGFGTRSEFISLCQLYDRKNTKMLAFSELTKILKQNPYRFSNEQIQSVKNLLNVHSENDKINYIDFATKFRSK